MINEWNQNLLHCRYIRRHTSTQIKINWNAKDLVEVSFFFAFFLHCKTNCHLSFRRWLHICVQCNQETVLTVMPLHDCISFFLILILMCAYNMHLKLYILLYLQQKKSNCGCGTFVKNAYLIADALKLENVVFALMNAHISGSKLQYPIVLNVCHHRWSHKGFSGVILFSVFKGVEGGLKKGQIAHMKTHVCC